MVEPQHMTGGGGTLYKRGTRQWTMGRTEARSTDVGNIDGAVKLRRE